MSTSTTAAIPLHKRLSQEWELLAPTQQDFPGIGSRTCADLDLELRATTGVENDRLVLELITAAQAGHTASERVLLNYLLPNAIHHARSCRGLRSLSPADAIASSLSATWEAIAVYPTSRTKAVRANVGLEALKIITNRLGAGVDMEIAIGDPEDVVSVESRDNMTAWGDDTDRDLVDVLRWAVDTGTLDEAEVRMLVWYDLGNDDARTALAERLGIKRDSLNRKVLRVRNQLVDAVRNHVRAHGAW